MPLIGIVGALGGGTSCFSGVVWFNATGSGIEWGIYWVCLFFLFPWWRWFINDGGSTFDRARCRRESVFFGFLWKTWDTVKNKEIDINAQKKIAHCEGLIFGNREDFICVSGWGKLRIKQDYGRLNLESDPAIVCPIESEMIMPRQKNGGNKNFLHFYFFVITDSKSVRFGKNRSFELGPWTSQLFLNFRFFSHRFSFASERKWMRKKIETPRKLKKSCEVQGASSELWAFSNADKKKL